MIYVGVDPGLTGAVAVLNGLNAYVIDMPVIKVGKRHDYVVGDLVSIFDVASFREAKVGVEALHAMPKNGGIGNFSMGRSSGLLEGILSAFHIPFQKIPPQRWKKVLLDGMPKEKGSSVVVAKRLFPEIDLSLVKHHGRADALLIAEFLRCGGFPIGKLRGTEE